VVKTITDPGNFSGIEAVGKLTGIKYESVLMLW